MNFRSGGRPRGSQAHRPGPDGEHHEPTAHPRLERDLRDPRGLRRARAERTRDVGSGGIGLGGLLRFAVFALVLGALVVAIGLTALRPIVARVVVDLAGTNPGALSIPFVADLVREDLGPALTTPASSDPTQVEFTVVAGDTASTIAARLADRGLVKDQRAFVFIAVERGSDTKLEVGSFILRKNLTPEQLVGSLLEAQAPSVTITLREGLRIEQISAKLQTLPLTMNVNRFYQLAENPPSSLLSSRPWLDLPEGASLEGYLAGDTYRVLLDTTPEEFLGILLDRFHELVTDARMTVPAARGMTFRQVLVLASIVEQEAAVDAERPLIAGVYQKRLDKGMLLESDPTVIYANDTVELAKLTFDQWPRYLFGAPFKGLSTAQFPKELAGFQTYAHKGLPPAPICTPTAASIDAALSPDTSNGYLFFVAKGDGSKTHAFAKTYKEHLANLKKYGYQ